ncbi:unnamed protein product [Aphis gossypii]|uniref:Uncharacterized protein n=1 Tax=Aphis gossypii TaxID=80765 RepID=A0A9P0J7U0_APHGO|nr:unnamed protein product [Aphis gossypii]
MSNMPDARVGHSVLLPRRARDVRTVHADAAEHEQRPRKSLPAVPDVDVAVVGHVDYGRQTDRVVYSGEGDVLQLAARVHRTYFRPVRQRSRVRMSARADRPAVPGDHVPVAGHVRTVVRARVKLTFRISCFQQNQLKVNDLKDIIKNRRRTYLAQSTYGMIWVMISRISRSRIQAALFMVNNHRSEKNDVDKVPPDARYRITCFDENDRLRI